MPRKEKSKLKIISLGGISEIGKNITPTLGILGDIKESITMVTERLNEANHKEWIDSFKPLEKKEYEKVFVKEVENCTGDIHMGEVVDKISKATGNKAVLVTDVGQNQIMSARYFKYKQTRSVITSGGLGTMGFGLPAAMGAKVGAPDRTVCAFCGDGGLQMTIQELTTIMQTEVDVKIILLNNFYLGNVRQWQEMFFDHRYSFTDLIDPDFGGIATANKIGYVCVEKREDLAAAIAQMKESKGSFLLEVRVEREDNVLPMVAPGAGVSDMMLEFKK